MSELNKNYFHLWSYTCIPMYILNKKNYDYRNILIKYVRLKYLSFHTRNVIYDILYLKYQNKYDCMET